MAKAKSKPNDSDLFRKDDDVRWQYGVPPKDNVNFAWVQHFIHHLANTGSAGFVLADCMVALPGQLFEQAIHASSGIN